MAYKIKYLSQGNRTPGIKYHTLPPLLASAMVHNVQSLLLCWYSVIRQPEPKLN